tara:strand:+ start:48 stop:404 length:357 start_codon:yes stop_codon:yes gene_type:complete
MTNKQKKQFSNFVQSTLKLLGCSLLFLGMTMALGQNADMELVSYALLFVGTILIMTHSFRGNDHMFLLVSSAGFLLVGNAFLGTETALALMPELAMTEDQGWFAKYGKLFVEILKAVT